MSVQAHGRARPPRSRGISPWADPAWLFAVAGLAAIASAVLIPAAESLAEARYQRDVALTWERERLDRLDRHAAYLASIRAREPATVRQLRAMQLNLYPEGLEPLGQAPQDLGLVTASVFERLEPMPLTRPEPPAHRSDRSRLAAWATGEQSRLWLLAGGAASLLVGLLPPVTRRGPSGGLTGDAPEAGGATVSA